MQILTGLVTHKIKHTETDISAHFVLRNKDSTETIGYVVASGGRDLDGNFSYGAVYFQNQGPAADCYREWLDGSVQLLETTGWVHDLLYDQAPDYGRKRYILKVPQDVFGNCAPLLLAPPSLQAAHRRERKLIEALSQIVWGIGWRYEETQPAILADVHVFTGNIPEGVSAHGWSIVLQKTPIGLVTSTFELVKMPRRQLAAVHVSCPCPLLDTKDAQVGCAFDETQLSRELIAHGMQELRAYTKLHTKEEVRNFSRITRSK